MQTKELNLKFDLPRFHWNKTYLCSDGIVATNGIASAESDKSKW